MKKLNYLFLPFIVLLLFSCGSGRNASSSMEPGRGELLNESTADYSDKNQELKGETHLRQVNYHASLQLKVDDPTGLSKKVIEIAKQNGGYLQHGNEVSLEIKVLADSLEAALESISQLGEVSHQSIYSNDVTDHYKDLKLRLDGATKTRDRYLELLAKADKVSDILLIERELERLNLKIESLKGRVNQLSQSLEYSKIYVGIREKIKPGPIGYIFVGLWKGIKFLFVRN